MVVLELEAVYAQAAPHTKLLNKRFVGAHHWLGPLKEALVARLAADKVRTRFPAIIFAPRFIATIVYQSFLSFDKHVEYISDM